MLTEETITAAKNNDLAAIAAVIEETEPLIMSSALYHATISGRTNDELRDDLAQTGRIAVWEGISRFNGTSVSQFLKFLERTVYGALTDARKVETRPGVSRSVANDFEKALRLAGGDPYEAQKMATQAEHMGPRKMTPETAYAARLAWQGITSLDLPAGEDASGETVGSLIPGNLGVPEDLVQPGDIVTARQRAVKDAVHRALDAIPKRPRFILKATFGIDPVPLYGRDNDDELAADMEISKTTLQETRSRAMRQFETAYVKGAALPAVL